MLIVTDRPEDTQDLVAPFLRISATHAAADLDDATSRLWAGLGGSAPAWVSDVPSALAPGAGFWTRLLILSSVSSSPFDALRSRLSEAVRDIGPVVCVAGCGSGLHGQRGRHWVAAPGNLHLSVALPLRLPASASAAALCMLPAVAVVDAITDATRGRLRPDIKWISDVLVDGAKIAGGLTATQVLGHAIDFVALGVGINVATPPPVVCTPFVPSVGCLHQQPAGRDVTLGALLWKLLDALSTRFDRVRIRENASLYEDYRRHSAVIGQPVRIWDDGATSDVDVTRWPAPLARGLAVDIGSDLGLGLEGRPAPVDRGRLAFEGACQAFGL